MTKQPYCFMIVAGEKFINIHGKLTTVCTTKHKFYVDNNIAQSSSQFGNYKYRYCQVIYTTGLFHIFYNFMEITLDI